MARAMNKSIGEAPSVHNGCSCKITACYFKKLCSCKEAGKSCTSHCSCGIKKPCRNNKLISEEPTTTANSESDEVREVTEEMAALTTSEAPSSTHDGCSCKPTSSCAQNKGRGPCPCRVAGRLCTSHCSCDVKKPCSNKHKSVEPTTNANSGSDEVARGVATMAISQATTESTDLAETNTNVSTTTRGGCSFDALINGEKNYCCNPSYLIDLEREVATTDEKEDRLDERVITHRRVKKLIDHVDSIFKGAETQEKEVEKFYIGKTYLNANGRRGITFDTMNPETWKKKGIKQRWDGRYNTTDYMCDGLIVFTVVTNKLLPPRLDARDKERYTLLLEQRLLHYYRLENYDPRLGNETFEEGKKAGGGDIGYVLYVAVKFKEQKDD